MTKPSNDNHPRTRSIALGKLRANPFAQRRLIDSHVEHLLTNLDLDLIGLPDVADRPDDDAYDVLDGQHRLEALKVWMGDGWETQKIQCRVWFGLSEAEKADKFDRLNDTRNVSAFDKFRIRVNAGRPVQCDIDRQVRLEGLVISRDEIPGAIGAVGTLEKVYRRSDAATLGRSLRIIRDAYGDTGFEASIIDGIGHLCQRYNGQLDDATAVAKLGGVNAGIKGLRGRANVIREKMGTSKSIAVAATAVEFINSGKGGKKLPSWWADE